MAHSARRGIPLLSPYLRGLALALLGTALCEATVQGASPPNGVLGAFLGFVTNCPPIEELVVDVQQGLTPVRYQFRYQSNAFFGRQLCGTNHSLQVECTNDVMCGRWNDEYWFFATNGFLHHYQFERSDPKAQAYVGQLNLTLALGFVQSFGSSDQGIDSLQYTQGRLRFVDRDRGYTNQLELRVEAGVPLGATLARRMDRKVTVPCVYEWRFDPAIAPAGIPVEVMIDRTPYKSIRIRSLKLGSHAHPLPRESFLPEFPLSHPPLAHVVHTNRSDFLVKDGQMVSLEVAREEEQAHRDAVRMRFYVGSAVFLLLLAPLWRAFGRKQK